MKMLLEFDLEKSVQALNFLAVRAGGNISKLKAIKLIWLADRLHLREYGRPITNDAYFAMKLGPVCSGVKDLAEASMVEDGERDYLELYLARDESNYTVISKHAVDLDVFSDSEIEVLEKVFDTFGNIEKFDISKLSHDFPEWKKFEPELESGSSFRKPMSYTDFFLNPTNKNYPLFGQSEEKLKAAKEQFSENFAVANYWQ